MKVFARRPIRRLAYALAALLLLFAAVHSPPVRGIVRSLAVRAVERLAGGSASIETLEYRLWRGEIRALRVAWRSSAGEASVSEVGIRAAPFQPLEVRIYQPEVRWTMTDGSEPSGRIPEVLLRSRVRVEEGSLRLEWPSADRSVSISSIAAEIEPGVTRASATLEASALVVRAGEREVELGPASARVELEPAAIRIEEARVEKGGSFVAASGTLEELRFRHSIDAALLAEIDPRLEAAGIVEGEGVLRAPSSASPAGEGVLRSSSLTLDPLGAVAIEVPWRFEGDEARAEIAFEMLETNALAPLSSRVSGRLTLELPDFRAEAARGEGTVRLEGIPRAGALPVSGAIQLRLDGKALEFEAPRLEAPGIAITSSGRAGEELAIAYRARVREIAAVPLLPPALARVRGALDLTGTIEGRWDAPVVEARVSGDDLAVGSDWFSAEGELSHDSGRIEVRSLTLRQAQGGTFEARGSVPTREGAGPFRLSARVEDFELSGLTDSVASGSLSGSLAVTGELSRPEVEIDLETADLSTPEGLRAQVTAQARTRGRAGTASLRIENPSFRDIALPGLSLQLDSDGTQAEFLARLADGRAAANAVVGMKAPYPFVAEVPLENLPFLELRPLFPALVEAQVELDLEGRAHVEGSLAEPADVRYRMEIARILGVYRGIALGATSPFQVEGTPESFAITDLTLVGEDTAIGIDGVVPLSREGGVFLRARGATRLELLKPWVPELELAGWANVDVRVEGALPDPWLRGEIGIEEASARIAGVPLSKVRARVEWTDRAIALEELAGEALGGAFRIAGELPPELGARAASTLRFRAEGIDPLLLGGGGEPAIEEARTRVDLEGAITGSGTDPSLWSGAGSIESVRLELRDVQIGNEGPAPWSLSEGRIALEGLRLANGATLLSLSGEARPLEEPPSWVVRATGRVDHEISRLVLAELGASLTGATDVDFRASSDPSGEAPFLLEGRGSFRDARLTLRDPAIAFTNVSGEIALSRNEVRLTRLDGDAGGGKVTAEGTIAFSKDGIGNVDLRAHADSVRLNYPEGLRSAIAGDFHLSGGGEALRLSGEAVLANALFSRDINVETQILHSLSRVARLSTPGSFASRVALDLRVRAAESFRIDNNLARMEASVSLAVTGSVASPEISGNVTARSGGRFRFGGNTYRVESGRIQLRSYPSEPPELDITARTSVGDYDVSLVLRGPTDDLQTELTSESHPQLSRGDIASLLLTGRTLNEISGEGRAVVGERMASYLGSTLADLAQLGLGQTLPFDIVTVQPALIAGEANPGARFTLGAQLTDRLSVVYSIALDDSEDQIWLVDYELPARTRSQLIRDENNEFTLGLAQELRFDLHGRDPAEGRERPAVAEVSLTGLSASSAAAEEPELRRRLRTKSGREFDYWRAWEDAERLRSLLRERGYLEAIVDVSTEISEGGEAAVAFTVDTGPRIRFEFRGDEPDSSMEEALRGAWIGGSGDDFLASDLAQLAKGRLYERGYQTAAVLVEPTRTAEEAVVRVEIERGPRGKRVVVDFTGNEAFADPELLRDLPNPSSAEFYDLLTTKRPRLKQLLELRYASAGFIGASIGDPETAFDETKEEYRVTIPVVEGENFRVGAIRIEGAAAIPEAELRATLSLREGEPFSVDAFVRDRSALANYYRDRGHPDVQVGSEVRERPGMPLVDVSYEVTEGPRVTIGDVAVVGNEHTRESVIRREIAFSPGDPLSRSALSRTERRLYELGVFQSAEVAVAEETAEGERRDLRVQVRESPDLELDYGGRLSTDGFFEVLAEIRAPNLFGRAQHVALRTLLGSERKIVRLAYHSPYFSRYRLATDFFLERSILYEGPEPIEGSELTTTPFTDRTWTFTAQQMRPLVEDDLTLQWSYSFDRVVTEVEDFLGSVFVQNNHIFTGALIGDYRDSLVRPSRGSFWTLSLQAAPEALGSDLKLVQLFGQLYTYVSLGERIVWAGGYRAGVGTSFGEELDPKYGFRTGGPSSVRGFEQNDLGPVDPLLLVPVGGTGLLVLNQEIRFPLFWRLGGVGFYDAGNAFLTPSDIRISELRQNVGAGIRFELPFGLIRLDGARVLWPREGESRWRFVFSIGHAF